MQLIRFKASASNTIFNLFLFFNTLLHAQQLEVSADKNPAIVGEQILIQYSINPLNKGKNIDLKIVADQNKKKGERFKNPKTNLIK